MSTAKAAVDIQVHLPTITYLTTPIMVFFYFARITGTHSEKHGTMLKL
jgi:hypothetical protein